MKSQRDVKLRCLFERRGQPLRAKMFVNFEFREQDKIEQRSPIKKKSLFSSVLVANNGRLALRAWVRYDSLEIFLRVVSTLRVDLPRTHNATEKKRQHLHGYLCGKVDVFGISNLLLYR